MSLTGEDVLPLIAPAAELIDKAINLATTKLNEAE